MEATIVILIYLVQCILDKVLQVGLCTPCNDEPSVLYAEGISIHLPKSTCKVASHGETNFIYNYSKGLILPLFQRL